MLPEDADQAKIALRHDQLGLYLSQAGRHNQALQHAEEAVKIWRGLTASSPDQHRPDLAEALINLGRGLSCMGRRAQALTVTEEAVAILRELAASPDKYAELAGVLTNLGSSLSELGRSADALPATEEAVAMYRELAAINPDLYRPSSLTR